MREAEGEVVGLGVPKGCGRLVGRMMRMCEELMLMEGSVEVVGCAEDGGNGQSRELLMHRARDQGGLLAVRRWD